MQRNFIGLFVPTFLGRARVREGRESWRLPLDLTLLVHPPGIKLLVSCLTSEYHRTPRREIPSGQLDFATTRPASVECRQHVAPLAAPSLACSSRIAHPVSL